PGRFALGHPPVVTLLFSALRKRCSSMTELVSTLGQVLVTTSFARVMRASLPAPRTRQRTRSLAAARFIASAWVSSPCVPRDSLGARNADASCVVDRAPLPHRPENSGKASRKGDDRNALSSACGNGVPPAGKRVVAARALANNGPCRLNE